MKSTVNFFSLENSQDLILSICFLTKRLYKLGKSVVIVDTTSNINKIDKLLWTFEQNSFLPHKLYSPKDELDTPIMLLCEKNLNNLLVFNKYNSIINNFEKPLLGTNENIDIYEFVEDSEDKKIISRNKYSLYKQNNFNLNYKKYDEQAV